MTPGVMNACVSRRAVVPGIRLRTAACALVLLAQCAHAQVVEVRMLGEQFVPAELRIAAGTTVRWVNAEKRTSHSLIFPEEGSAETERLFPGESWQRTFAQPGRYPYVCGPHPNMKGVVEVVLP